MQISLYIVLPAYNEEKNVHNVLTSISRDLAEILEHTHVIIVDDGSIDGTYDKCLEYKNLVNLNVLKNPKNLGLPKTLESGFKFALSKSKDDDIVICMDCDSSHLASQIYSMIEQIEKGSDVVVASRYQKGSSVQGVTGFRKLLSFGASFLFSNLLRIPNLKDYSSGYRAYRAKNLKDTLSKEGDRIFSLKGFACSTAIILSIYRHTNAKISEIPIDLRYDQKQGASKIKIFTTVVATLKLLVFETFLAKKKR